MTCLYCNPVRTRTEKTPGVIAAQAVAQGISEAEVERRLAQGNSSRRIVDAREIAYVVAFLASPKSVAIHGDVISAGGGGRETYYCHWAACDLLAPGRVATMEVPYLRRDQAGRSGR